MNSPHKARIIQTSKVKTRYKNPYGKCTGPNRLSSTSVYTAASRRINSYSLDDKEIKLKLKADCPSCGAQINVLTAVRAANPFSFKCTNCHLRLPEEANRITTPVWAIIFSGCCLGAVFGHLKWHYGLGGLAFGVLMLMLWFAMELSATLSSLVVSEPEGAGTQGKLRGVRGWLLIFCLLSMVFLPVQTLYGLTWLLIAFNKLPSNTSAQLGVILTVTGLGLFISLFGIYNGISIIKHNKNAINIAKMFLLTTLVVSIAASLSPLIFMPNIGASELIKENASYFSQRLVFSLTWFIYFARSERVKANFPV